MAKIVFWQTASGSKLSFHRWPEQYAVYNPLSGHTHLLELVAGEMLVAIDQKPQTTEELCAGVAAGLETPLDHTVKTQVARVLAQLDEIGLIEPSTPCASRTSR